MTTSKIKGLVDELKGICECSICYVEFDEKNNVPRVLPCQHTFCSECLSNHCKRTKIKCFLCNQEHQLQNKDITVFPKDYTRCDLKDLLERFSQQLCGVCQRHDNVKHYCATCDLRMCQECFKERKATVCSTHTAVISEDLLVAREETLDSKTIQSKSICLLPGHENNELKFYCSENMCCKPICANCIIEAHKEHAYRTANDEFENRKKNMKSRCQATKEQIDKVKITLNNIEKECESLQDDDSKEREKLASVAKKGIKYIHDFEEKITEKTDEILQKSLGILERRRHRLQAFVENATECCAISAEALIENNFVTFLTVEKTLTEKLTCFSEFEMDDFKDKVPKEDYFDIQNPILDLGKRIDRMIRDEDSITERKKINEKHESTSYRRVFASMIGCLFAYGILFLLIFPIPYTSVFKIDRSSYLALPDNQTSLMCYSADRRMVSNIPMDNMKQTCGNAERYYIYRGAFTNTSLLYRIGESVKIQMFVSEIKNYSPGLVLFEFGISMGSIERPTTAGVHSFHFYGWHLKMLNTRGETVLINSENKIIQNYIFRM